MTNNTMPTSERIGVGDIVDVFFTGETMPAILNARVAYFPTSPGDSWVIQTSCGVTVHVQHFQSLWLRQKKETPDDE